jgi:hypothetical protein
MLPRREGFEGDGRFSLSPSLSFLKDPEDTVVVINAPGRVTGIVLGDDAPMLPADSGGLAEFSIWTEGLSWPTERSSNLALNSLGSSGLICSAFGRCLAFPELFVVCVKLWVESSTEAPVVYNMVVVMMGKRDDELGEVEVGWDPNGLNATVIAAQHQSQK